MRYLKIGTMLSILCLLGVTSLSLFTFSCGGNTCGTGTYEEGGECRATDDVLTCGVGFEAIGNRCEPAEDWKKSACGTNTKYNAVTGQCEGSGGGAVVCDKQCPLADGNKVCMSGRMFEAVSYLTGSAETATPITPNDGMEVRVYDPLALKNNPDIEPLAVTSIYNDKGCWIAENVTIPFLGYATATVRNSESGDGRWYNTTNPIILTKDRNVENVDTIAFLLKDVEAFGNGIKDKGFMLMHYIDLSNKPVEGVLPAKQTAPWPWEGEEEVFFFDDITQPPYFSSELAATNSSGLAIITNAELANYSGIKGDCTITTSIGGSSPNSVLYLFRTVEGC